MTQQHFIKKSLFSAAILITGLGIALVLPRSARSQGTASLSETSGQTSFQNLPLPENVFVIYPEKNTGLNPYSLHALEVTRYYVAKDGDGSDPTKGWNTAFSSLQDALKAAASLPAGAEIWVAEGVYYPDEGTGQAPNSRTSTFALTENVKVYGGFSTESTKFSDRNWKVNMSVLSGDIDKNDHADGNKVVRETDDINGNNAYHVVTADGTKGTAITDNTVLDGFTITAGQANADNFSYGGGFYCDASETSTQCNPKLDNLIFSGNYARYGGGMCNSSAFYNSSNPTLTNVTFSGNSADDGGAIYNKSWNPILRIAHYENNLKITGNALVKIDNNWGSNPRLIDVNFHNNSANKQGGAMCNSGIEGGNSSPVLMGVRFTENTAESGGAMYNEGVDGTSTSSPSLTDVTFTGNSADYGGAMYNDGHNGESFPTLNNVVFSGNSANYYGGAMYNNGTEGGNSSPGMTNVLFSGNSAEFHAGAIYNDGTNNGTSSPKMTNVTISGNQAVMVAGGIFNNGIRGSCKPRIRNSILWNNQDATGNDTIFANISNNAAFTELSYSITEGAGASGIDNWTTNTSYIDKGGNIHTNPKFRAPVNPSSAPTIKGNLRLSIYSPAIDVGNNDYMTGVHTDIDGRDRVQDGDGDGTEFVDMGAYENGYYEFFIPLVSQ